LLWVVVGLEKKGKNIRKKKKSINPRTRCGHHGQKRKRKKKIKNSPSSTGSTEKEEKKCINIYIERQGRWMQPAKRKEKLNKTINKGQPHKSKSTARLKIKF